MPRRASSASAERSIAMSLREYARGIAGGLMFSLPLLYTMEMWWAGFTSHPERLLVYVVVTFALLVGYNRYAGLRRDASWLEVAIDSVEEMGLGLFVAALMLFLLGQITSEMELNEIVGKVVMEAMTVAIGVSIGTAQLGSTDPADEEDKGVKKDPARREADLGSQLVLALCGAVLFAANVAPTEEISLIAHSISSWRLIGLALLSIALGGLILFYSEFRGSKRFTSKTGAIHIVSMTAVSYTIALLASFMILWFFGRLDGESIVTCLGQSVVLGVAGALGASAGRLLLQ
jgi:putative integral membrane protein (TIGR02587 family)